MINAIKTIKKRIPIHITKLNTLHIDILNGTSTGTSTGTSAFPSTSAIFVITNHLLTFLTF